MKFAEVLEINQDIAEIHTNEYINPLFFGKISLLPNNYIYSDQHSVKPLARNGKDLSIHKILYNAITGHSNWRLTRKKIKPCNCCVAKYICPPISNFEMYFNEYKICDK